MKKTDIENGIPCFLAVFDCSTFIIPCQFREEFDGTPYFERYERFEQFILPDDGVLNEILVDKLDLTAIIEGDFN